MITNFGYHNKIDAKSLLDFLDENNTCLEFQELEEIKAIILNIDDEVEHGNVISLKVIRYKETIRGEYPLG